MNAFINDLNQQMDIKIIKIQLLSYVNQKIFCDDSII